MTDDDRGSAGHPLRLWRQERAWTRQLVAAFPESAFEWRPAPDAFSCGELVIHLLQAERFWRRLLVEAAAGRRYDPFHLTGIADERYAAFRQPNFESARTSRYPATFAGCLDRWAAEQAETEAAFSAFTAEQLDNAIVHHPVAGLVVPLAAMIWFMTSHEVHHRGQLSAYAKMLGLPQPPLYTGDFGADAMADTVASADAGATEAVVAEKLPRVEPEP